MTWQPQGRQDVDL